MSDGTPSLTMAQALAEATVEVGQVNPTATDTGVPLVDVNAAAPGEQAIAIEGEQSAADEVGFSVDASGLEAALLDTTVDSQNGSEPGLVPGSDDFWNHMVGIETVEGQTNVSIRELSEGYLRQADYTRKTQALAEQRKHADKAVQFLDTFNSDPHEFVRSLSVQAGFITEGDRPVKDMPTVKIPTQEELDSLVNEMVEERVKSHPSVQSAEISDARSAVNTEFDRLQTVFNIQLSPELRDSLIQEATNRQSADLEAILARRILVAQQKQGQASSTNLASTARPGSPPAVATSPEGTEVPAKPTIREAYAAAVAEAAMQ